MSDNIKCDRSQSGVAGWFFPKNHPFLLGKQWFWIGKVQQTVEKNIEQMNKIIKKINRNFQFSIISDDIVWVRTQKNPKTHILAVLSRAKPIFIPY